MSFDSVLVAGMGKSGAATVKVIRDRAKSVSVYDIKKEEDIEENLRRYLKKECEYCFFGIEPDEDTVKKFDMLILSPGISPKLNFVKYAQQAGIEITGELEMAYRLGKGRYIAITGTNGKTTTTSLVGEIVEKSGLNTVVAGNIGLPVISEVIGADENTVFVTEVSSFQLETVSRFSPEVSAILNITPDHLDRHGSLENYAEAKGRIFKNQGENQYLIVNRDDELAWQTALSAKCRVVPFSRKTEQNFGCFLRDEKIVIANGKNEIEIIKVSDIKIPGTHNLENVLAACGICYFFGIKVEDIRRGIIEFQGVEHRIEPVLEINGVRYVNDSKGTNVDAAIKAVEAMGYNIILIAGGYDKGADFHEFINAFCGRVKHMLVLGATKEKLKKSALDQGFTDVTEVSDIGEAVQIASELAVCGDVVLLSPACASWGMYDNFEQRGKHFKECVQKLIK